MWIQIRSMDGKKSIRIDGLSKLTKIEDLRQKLVEEFEAEPERQRLFYRGKQLVDGHTLFDYNVGLNEIVQIMVRQAVEATKIQAEKETFDKENMEPNIGEVEPSTSTNQEESIAVDFDSKYKVGDIIDSRDETMGAWFEAKLVKVTKRTEEEKLAKSDIKMEVESTKSEETKEIEKENEEKENEGDINGNDDVKDDVESLLPKEKEEVAKKYELPYVVEEDEFIYHCVFEGYEDDDIIKQSSIHMRPRARNKKSLEKIEIGDKVMVNYNYDEPEARGYWYDAIVTEKRNTRTIKELTCTVFIGKDLVPMENCKILFVYEIFEIEKPGTQMNSNDPGSAANSPVKRQNKPECDHCLDNPKKKCKECACHKCGGKGDPEKQLICDECDMAYHIFCLSPPLESIPDIEEWYCPLCKVDANEVVQAGEKLKESKKKSKMASASSKSSRDWGKGMACVGRTKMCNIVPPNHFGPIPGIEVGTLWKFRVQVSEAGVHRPHVAGIHGREDDGSFSIVLSGGYEDDTDNGDEFYYTGSGGRDLSGNKRTAEQSCDQTLTRMNKALAKNCAASVDPKKGGDSKKDWQKGKPVRVVRNCKGRKHSNYAPEEGNRYDGIYKIVKYWPEKGKSGFLVWRYLLRRDDPIPAPWTKAGKKRTKELGLEMQYPDGWLEKEKAKEKEKESGESKGKKKRKRVESDDDNNSDTPKSPVKKVKVTAYKIKPEISKLIKSDTANKKIWDEALQYTKEGSQKFLAHLEESFCCICCQDIVFKPVTTECSHNICKACITRSFKADVHNCPACRYELGKDYNIKINKPLADILKALFPGYEAGRE